MNDREKVITELKAYINYPEPLCSIVKDVLELLKEKEPVEPKLVGVNTWTCSKCGTLLGWEDFSQSGLELISYKYCPGCGRKVKWDADGS